MHTLHDARLYAILDTAYVSRAEWAAKCAALIGGGVDIVQVRAKGASRAECAELVAEILPQFEPPGAPVLVINDDAELAAATPGAGLHIGQDDMPVEEARGIIGTGRILGLSTHSLPQALGAVGKRALLDYFAVGPVFATPTKPDYTPVGLRLVSDVAAHLKAHPEIRLPFFAIGGITRGTLPEVLSAGAERVVVVSDILKDADSAQAARAIRLATARKDG